MADATPLKPGDTIGILGGGQLARMLALAAAPLGLKCHIYAPEADSPAFDVSAARTIAAYDDRQALERFANSVAVVTYEFENVPAATAELLSRIVPVRPGARALAVTQDRLPEKQLARELGELTADFSAVDSLDDLRRALQRQGAPAILKTRRFGYDGKGQVMIRAVSEAESAWAAVAGKPCILESLVPFTREVSVVAARGMDGSFAAYEPVENEHRHHILHSSVVPAAITPETAARAIKSAGKLGAALDYIGVFAVEFFITGEGADQRALVNEIAPRVHNSGHWTIEGAETSQFEQHIRAVAGWPLGSTLRRGRRVEMLNLIGDDVAAWRGILSEPGAHLHLYGKAEARPGRKMGHVTRIEWQGRNRPSLSSLRDDISPSRGENCSGSD